MDLAELKIVRCIEPGKRLGNERWGVPQTEVVIHFDEQMDLLFMRLNILNGTPVGHIENRAGISAAAWKTANWCFQCEPSPQGHDSRHCWS